MWRLLFAGLLVAHGLVHIAVWGSSKTGHTQGSDPAHSWVLGDQRSVALLLMTGATALFALAGVGLLIQGEWWRTATVLAAAVSLLLVALYPAAFTDAWIAAPVAIDVGLILGIVALSWPSKTLVGA